jgi:TolB-like protein/class 3 adenylate cyclase
MRPQTIRRPRSATLHEIEPVKKLFFQKGYDVVKQIDRTIMLRAGERIGPFNAYPGFGGQPRLNPARDGAHDPFQTNIAGHQPAILLYNIQFPRARGAIVSSTHVERRLAAILAADVAGSCRLIGIDEEGTLAQLKALRKTLFDPKIAEHHGRIVKNTGDGALVEFASVVDALRCADEIQRGVAEQNIDVPRVKRIEFRIGIHIGDVIIEENDIFGDGVNIAVRLEGIAEPGGVSISDDAYRQVRGKIGIDCDDMGPQLLKNISEPMRVWRARIGPRASQAMLTKPPTETAQTLAFPDKPSIAVLPFENMSGDPEQDYFADGMVEDIITALSRFSELFVIARNSSFTYKGRAVDVKQVGRELGVRYVLEGSVRRAGNRVRITVQLIDTATGAHIWADRFDGALEDIFDLQDQLSAMIVGAISPKLQQAEIERARRKPTESLQAYDYYLRGMASFHHGSRKSLAQALELFKKAIELDPGFASAYAMAAWCYSVPFFWFWSAGREEAREADRLARLAARLGTDDAAALCVAGFVIAYIARDFDMGMAIVSRALALNPNLGTAWFLGGWVRVLNGEPDVAIEHFAHAQRLSPFDPFIWGVHAGIANAHFCAGRDDQALSAAEYCLRDMPNFVWTLSIVAASSALTGATDRASKTIACIRELNPGWCISEITKRIPFRRLEYKARMIEGLRKAGMPE